MSALDKSALEAAAKYLVKTVERKAWDGIRADGRARDGGYPPYHGSNWTWGINMNARQQDYIDVVTEIVRLANGGEPREAAE